MEEPNKEDKIKELEAKCEEYLNGWKRAKADYQNLEKEMSNRLSQTGELATALILAKFLPLVDNMARALSHVPVEEKDKEWASGLTQIEKQFTQILSDLQIKKISALGVKFDPKIHEAIGERESDGEEGMVLEEAQAGYIWKDKVLRPAKVIVGKNN